MQGSRIVAGVAAVLVSALLAGEALASTGAPRGMSPQAYTALMQRSIAMNRLYGLGEAGGSRDTGSEAAALRALRIRAIGMNAKFHLGAYTVVRPQSSFRWADAAIGAAAMLGLVLVALGAFIAVRHQIHHGAETVPTA